jgi:hypothetical protein
VGSLTSHNPIGLQGLLWDSFTLLLLLHLINERVNLNVSLKTEDDIEAAVKFFSSTTQWAGWNATPEHTHTLKTPTALY